MTINRITRNIKVAANAVKAGKIVAYPTETVYGLGALALEKSTVEKVIALKQMTLMKPISLAVSNFSMLEAVAFVEDVGPSPPIVARADYRSFTKKGYRSGHPYGRR